MKDTLDNLEYGALEEKAVGLIFHGSTVKKCALPCECLVLVLRMLYEYALQYQVAVTDVFAFEDEGCT